MGEHYKLDKPTNIFWMMFSSTHCGMWVKKTIVALYVTFQIRHAVIWVREYVGCLIGLRNCCIGHKTKVTHRAWSSKVLECRVDLWRLLWWLQTIHWVFPKSKHLNDITTKLNKYASCWEIVVPKEFIHGKILHVYIAQWINEWMDVADWMVGWSYI